MATYTYSITESGYEYTTGTVEAADIDGAAEAASAFAKAAPRAAYTKGDPDAGEDVGSFGVDHFVRVEAEDGESKTVRVTVETE